MLNLEGSYKVYLDGELVSESKNIITTVGKSVIRKYLAGTYPNWAYALGAGVGTGSTTTAAAVGDVKLQYEIERQPITYKSTYTSGTDELILLKANFSNSLVAVIKEVGVFPSITTSSSGLYNDRVLADFSESWTGGNTSAVASLVGSANREFNFAGQTAMSLTGLAVAMDGYSPDDKISLLLTNGNATAKTLTVTLTGTLGSKAYTFTTDSTATTQIKDLTLDTGPASIGTLNSISIACSTLTSGQSVSLDAIKLVNYDEYGPAADMVSRSVLSTPITKVAGQELEIEYSLKVQ